MTNIDAQADESPYSWPTGTPGDPQSVDGITVGPDNRCVEVTVAGLGDRRAVYADLDLTQGLSPIEARHIGRALVMGANKAELIGLDWLEDGNYFGHELTLLFAPDVKMTWQERRNLGDTLRAVALNCGIVQEAMRRTHAEWEAEYRASFVED